MADEGIIHQSKGFFDFSDTPIDAILPLQTITSQPQIEGLENSTGLLYPDVVFDRRVAHFPEALYDLSPTSHLTRFLKALLGDAGVGQLRKRQGIARLQNEMESTHFFDLDRFYGALFGARRTFSERLAIDPMSDSATPDDWDDIHARDAAYRERIMALAKAISLGATVPGLQAAAEAVMGTEVDVYETWQVLDAYGSRTAVGRTWADMETTFGTWDAIPETMTWDTVQGVVSIGRSGAISRSEVIIRPKKQYGQGVEELIEEELDVLHAFMAPNPVVASKAGFKTKYEIAKEEMELAESPTALQAGTEEQRQQAEDEYALIRVLSVLKPASVLLTVDNQGMAHRRSVKIAGLVADSEYWEVIPKVKPRTALVKGANDPYGYSSDPSVAQPLARPPFAAKGGMSWSHNPQVVSATSYAFSTGSDDLSEPGIGAVTDTMRSDIVDYPDGSRVVYSADKGVLDPRKAVLAHYANDGVTTSHAYSGPRVQVPTWG